MVWLQKSWDSSHYETLKSNLAAKAEWTSLPSDIRDRLLNDVQEQMAEAILNQAVKDIQKPRTKRTLPIRKAKVDFVDAEEGGDDGGAAES